MMYPITLTSDFGLQNHYVASVKGKILSAIPEANIIDITHHIATHNLQQAAYVFKNSYLHFPIGTIHFVLNDLYAGSKKQLLYVYENGQHIFCADNGFLTLLFDDRPVQIFLLQELLHTYNYLSVSNLFAHAAQQLLQGVRPDMQTISVQDIIVKRSSFSFESNSSLEAQVLYIDNYGNVILNITKPHFIEIAKGRKFKILFMRDEEITQLSEHYNDVPVNDKLCLFNTAGHLEIAINKGNAAALFGFECGDERSLFYSNVKIFFE